MLISWARHHGRTEGLAELLGGLENRYVYPEVRIPRARTLSTALRYLVSSVLTTVSLLRARRQDRMVIVVAPPVFPVLLARIILKPSRLLIDAHSGAFVGERWRWSAPLLRRSARGCAALIVTNEAILQDDPVDCPVIVMHDPFEAWEEAEPEQPGYLLVPLGGGDDEPVDAIVAAAEAAGHPVILTGRGHPEVLPGNVEAVGFVALDRYQALVRGARVVVGITDRDFTMQRVGYEAMFAGRALVTSDFPVLRRFFADGAIYVRPEDPRSIAQGLRKAWAEAEALSDAMRGIRASRAEEQAAAVAQLRALLSRS